MLKRPPLRLCNEPIGQSRDHSFTLLPKIAVSLSISGSRVLFVHVGGEEFIVDARPQTNYPAFSITVRKMPLIRVE